MSTATATEPVKITAPVVRDPITVAGFNGAAAVAEMRAVIRTALDAAGTDKAEITRVRVAFQRGWIAKLLGNGKLTVASVTLAQKCLDTSDSARTPEEKRAAGAARTAWSRYSAGDNQTRAPGAGRPEGAAPPVATDDAGLPLSQKVKEVPAVIPANPAKRVLATTMQGWLAVKESITASRAQAEANPAAYSTPMLQALSRIDREWDKVKPAE